MIYVCEIEDFIDNDLRIIFQELFKGFMVESFKKICIDIKSKLQRHLLKRGIYIGKNSNKVTISELLFKVI